MKRLTILVSLTTDDNDYQREQAKSAEESARRLGCDVRILHADNDAINQSQQLLNAIQSSSGRPDGIVFEPVGGTALPQVARAAVAAGIGWGVLNREAEYVAELRATHPRTPVFSVSSDHQEIGRIQGRQFAALLPRGGSVLYIQGPAESSAAKQRTAGMYETKPVSIEIRAMKAHWTEESSYKVVSSWLRLSTSHEAKIDVVAAQDDSMAAGARRAFQELTLGSERDRWLGLAFTGCDGLPQEGQAMVRGGTLAATVIVPPNTGQAMEMLVKALQSGLQPPERTLTLPMSFPPIESLAAKVRKK